MKHLLVLIITAIVAAIVIALILVPGSIATFTSPIAPCDPAGHNLCMAACPDDYLTCIHRCPWPAHCPTPTPEADVRGTEVWRVWLPVVGR